MQDKLHLVEDSAVPRFLRSACPWLLVVFFVLAVRCSAQAHTDGNTATEMTQPASGPSAAWELDAKFTAAMARARQMVQDHQYAFVIDAYRKANKIAGGACSRCLQNIYEMQMKRGEYKDAAATSLQLEALATTPRERSLAKSGRGEALRLGAGNRADQLEEAHTALQAALADYPKNNSARFSDGCVLARMGRNEEASRQFAMCANAASANDPSRVRARHFAENPSLSLANMAPAFVVTALDGSRFNLDEMGGRVVLINFWATWWGPCNQELPHLQKIAKEFADQPLVIISVSWDADENKWKDFIGKHDMKWVQYRDADRSLSNRFGVQAIPHYFTIDSDGVLAAEMMGSGSDVEGRLRQLIKRAREPRPAGAEMATVAR